MSDVYYDDGDDGDDGYDVYVTELESEVLQLPPQAAAALSQRLSEAYITDLSELRGVVAQVQQEAASGGYPPEPEAADFAAPQAAAAQVGQLARGIRPGMLRMDQKVNASGVATTLYEDRATLGDRAAHGEEGQVIGPDGRPMHGKYAWVIDDATGLLLFLPENEVVVTVDGTEYRKTREEHMKFVREQRALGHNVKYQRIHHTTPTAGMPVTGAGIMELDNGYVVNYSDESGHYQPAAEDQYAAMQALEDQGISFQRPVSAQDSPDGVEGYRDANITITGAGGGPGGRPTSKADDLNQAKAENPYFDVGNLDLSAQQFEQTQGNEMQARNKDALNREFEATVAERLRRRAEGLPDEEPDAGQAQAGGQEAPPAPRNVPDPSYYEYEPDRRLYRNRNTYDYVDEDGNMVYRYDGGSGAYLDSQGNPV